MDLAWSAEQQASIAAAHRFAADALAPRAPARGFDHDAWRLCAAERITGLVAPRSWGGRELDALTTVGVLEALGRAGADRGLLFALGAHLFGCMVAVARWGSAAQQERWGAALVDGRAVAALAVTEESGGTSLAAIGTVAERVGGGYLLRGRKSYVTNGPVADVFLLIASENPRRGVMGLSALLVARDTPGLTVTPLEPTLGLPGAPLARLDLDGCALPPDAVLGRPGSGFAVLQLSLQWERTCILAGFLGAAERDLAAAVAFVAGRAAPHGTQLAQQAVAHRLARLRCTLEAARALLHRGAWAIDHGDDPRLWPAMVKWTLSETLVDAALETMRTHAAAGFLDGSGPATALRDVVGTLSASGTSDAQLDVVAASLERVPR